VPIPRKVWAIIAALGVVIVVAGYFAVRGGTPSPITSGPGGGSIEALLPQEGSEVLRQSTIGIDLEPGYSGTLVVNGTPIPDDQLTLVPELNQVFYEPKRGKVVDTLRAGENCITARFWQSAQGPDAAETRTWCFEAL
jgi:hypothetical protein